MLVSERETGGKFISKTELWYQKSAFLRLCERKKKEVVSRKDNLIVLYEKVYFYVCLVSLCSAIPTVCQSFLLYESRFR